MKGNKNNIWPFIFSTAIFIILEVAALNMLKRNGELQDIWISQGIHTFMAKIWGGTESVKKYFLLSKENETLAYDNYELSEKIRQYESILEDRETMNADSKIEKQKKYSYIPAKIAKISHNSQHNYMIINKGSKDGVCPNSGLITKFGAIGVIDAVDEHYSYALSFMNTNTKISARLHKDGSVGPLIWDGKSSNGAILKEIPLQTKFHSGDTVYTSGYSSMFPAEIPLGTTGKTKIVNGSTFEIEIKLFQDFTSLKYVTIVKNLGLKEINALIESQEQNEK